jgi:hypothetical protein
VVRRPTRDGDRGRRPGDLPRRLGAGPRLQHPAPSWCCASRPGPRSGWPRSRRW